MNYGARHYKLHRDWLSGADFYLTQIAAKETELQVFTSRKAERRMIEEKIRLLRLDIENYIERDRLFLVSLRPVEVAKDAPVIVKEMSRCARLINCGPMQTLAGAIAGYLGRALSDNGFKDVVVKNATSIFIKSSKTLAINFYTGRSKIWSRLKLKIRPKDTPLCVAIQEGRRAQDINFGCADNVFVLSSNAALAQGAAVSVANRINTKADMQRALDFARTIKGIEGVAIIMKNNMLSWGKVEITA
jgi:ApbE superfamily uncharacterized protein (UPF0280 family)